MGVGNSAAHRDDASFSAFVAMSGGRLLHSAELLVGDRHAAEDLLQTALTKTYQHWRKVEQPEAYVRRVLARSAIDAWRRQRWRETPTASPADVIGIAERSPDEAEATARRQTVLAALACLTPRERAVLVLRYYDDLSEAAVAAALGIATGTVKSTAFRALRRLRSVGLLADLDPGNPT